MARGKGPRHKKGKVSSDIFEIPFSNIRLAASKNSKYTYTNEAKTLHLDYGENNLGVSQPTSDRSVNFIINPSSMVRSIGKKNIINNQPQSPSLDIGYNQIGNNNNMVDHSEGSGENIT